MIVNKENVQLSMDDYKNHSSFIKIIEGGTAYILTMKSDKTIDGTYMALDNTIVGSEVYEIAFYKPNL